MSIEVVAVGDELLMGATLDTNSGFAARELLALGLEIQRVTVVGDDTTAICDAVAGALDRAPVVLVTGGLGPTVDDRTKEALAAHFGHDLVLDEETLEEIRNRFQRRGLVMPEINTKQALLPQEARKIPNPIGSAPGVHWTVDDRQVFLLPGVPMEMQAMLLDSVLPLLAGGPGRAPLPFAAFRTCGLAESVVAEKLQDIVTRFTTARWAFYPSTFGVDVKVRGTNDMAEAWPVLCDAVRRALPHVLYTEEPGESMPEVVQRLLIGAHKTLAVAESCTGGLVGARLTEVPGSSQYFTGGFVTYDNTAKIEWLGVAPDLVRTHGAVSVPVAAAMARGARTRARSDFGLAVTGVAGPTGGTPEKPVGLVYLGLASQDGTWTRKLLLGTRRDVNREVSSQLALDLLRRHLLGLPAGEPV